MQEEIKRQVQLAMSQMQSQSTPGVTISPVGQMKSSCASTELPVIQDDAELCFSVDDITEPLTICELHIPDGNNASIMVAVGVVSPMIERRHQESMGQLFNLDMLASRSIECSKVTTMFLLTLKAVMGRRH